jgi:tight adherence protein B
VSLVAILMAAAAIALIVPARDLTGRRPAQWSAPQPGVVGRVVVAVTAAAGLWLLFARGSLLVLGLILTGAAAGAARLVTAARDRREAARREEWVLETCEALVGELRAGQPPVAALAGCVEVWAEFEPVATAARLGADVPDAMRALGARPGAHGLRNVAGAWAVSHGSGAGLAVAVGQVAESSRESQATRRLVASELASARATARLVAALPVLALLMGSGLGGEPWHFLLGTPPGLACLGCGLALGWAGLFWIDRISAGVLAR